MSFNEWKINKLTDLSEKIGSGATPRGGSNVYLETGIPFIRSQNVYNCEFHEDGLVYIDEESARKLDNVKLCKNDIILNITGDSVARCTILPEKYIGGRVNQHVAIIRTNSKMLNSQFLKYFLVSPSMQAHMLSLARMGATRAALTKGMIESFEIPTPEIKEQEEIAHILSTLDDKIEVNNQINKTLENMTQAIFKQWFVDFEFPNEDGEPYKSSGGEMIESELGMIPKGWEVISLDKIVDVKSGYSYKGTDLSESNNAMVTIKNFDRNGGYKKDGLKEIIISDRVKKHHYIEINDVVVAHTDLTQGAEIIGNPVMVLSKGKYEKLIMSMDVVKVISKDNDIDNAFIYCLLKTDNFKQYALGYVNGTTVLHLSKKAIPQYKLPFPTDIKICKELSAILKTIMMKISLSDNENDNLNLTRDILLPKLMSGEIRVPMEEEGAAS